MSLQEYFYLFSGVAAAGLVVVFGLFTRISSIKVENTKASKIADAISEGAMAFLSQEYKIIGIVITVVAVFLGYFFSFMAGGVFVLSTLCSLGCGYLGMKAATMANVRTTMAAKDSGGHAAFMVAFFGGGVMGFSVASIGLFALSCMFFFFVERVDFIVLLTSFSLGASIVAFFARVGGGIYTKSADVGADLVGKIEAGIPEDDPRNPAVIADNVGDCVGDTAGMGADIYESYVSAIVSSIILAVSVYGSSYMYVTLPLMLAVFGLGGSFIGLLSNLIFKTSPSAMLRNATYFAITFLLISSYWYLWYMLIDQNLFIAIFAGCIAGVMIGLVTEHYTGGKPVEQVARSCETGAATNLISGLAFGMESTVIPVIILSIIVLVAHVYGGGLFGISLAAVAMLATVGITMTVDAYGPIADNAGGIAEMSGFDPKVRDITDKLDALGNTTAAMGKGFAIGSALLTALALFSAYAQEAGISGLNILDPFVLVGVFIGATVPFLVSALTMRSVGQAALEMVVEVRRQFREITGLMEGKAEPDYKRCIMISTKASLREMILPGVITIATPVVIRYTLGVTALGGLLVGSTIVGLLLALMMANAGGVWDNAKKYIESGKLGGKGSAAHKAAVVGDMVGDPFKDTSGPALNILIKLMSVIALLLALIG